MSATVSSVPKNCRASAERLAQERTADALGGVRSELPISPCSAVQSSAPAPVPALVEDDDAVTSPLGGERLETQPWRIGHPALSRPAREHEEHAVGRVDVVPHTHVQVQRTPSG